MNNLDCIAARAALLASLAFVSYAVIAPRPILAQQTPASPTPIQQHEDAAGTVVFNVTVTNKRGGYATGLDKSNFIVLDDKEPQAITYFRGQDEPVSIGIVLDVSRSMFNLGTKDLMKTLFNEAISRFIQQGNKSNEYFLIGFNERPQLMVDWTSNINEINAALGKIGAVGPKGHSTAFYDACYLGGEKLARSRHPKRTIILISDGQDNGSHYTFKDVRQLLRESNMLVYTVGMSNAVDWSSMLGLQGKGILDELAMVSGGVSFYPEKAAQVRNAFDFIAEELRHQYSIGFKPLTRPNERDWHRIKIKLALPADAPPELQHLIIRSREGYYLKANPR